MLPFTADVLFSSFALYNKALWPAQILAFALALAAVLLLQRAVEMETLTLKTVEEVAQVIRRSQAQPASRREEPS